MPCLPRRDCAPTPELPPAALRHPSSHPCAATETPDPASQRGCSPAESKWSDTERRIQEDPASGSRLVHDPQLPSTAYDARSQVTVPRPRPDRPTSAALRSPVAPPPRTPRSARCSAPRPCAGCPRTRTAPARAGRPASGAPGRPRSDRCRRRRRGWGTRPSPGCRTAPRRARRRRISCAWSTRDLVLEAGVHGQRVGGDDGHPYAGRGHPQLRQAEDLAGLVADLQLLRGPAVVRRRTRPTGTTFSASGRREGPVSSPTRAPYIARLGAQLGARDQRQLVAQGVDAGLSRAGDRLVRGDDQLARARTRRAARPPPRSSTASCSSGWR